MRSLRVATYNLYLGADVALLFTVSDAQELAAAVEEVRRQFAATRFDERAVALARVLAREQPDLVGLQEVARWTHGDTVVADFLPTLIRELAAAGCAYDVHAVNENFAGSLPLSDGETMVLSGANVTLVRRAPGLVITDERAASYASSHEVVTALGVRFPVVRSWGLVDVRAEELSLRFANTHLEAYDATTRDAQRDELLLELGDGPTVVVGDLNAEPHEVGMPEPWRDAWTGDDGFASGQSADLSNLESSLWQRIDYVWTRGVRVETCRLVGKLDDDRTVPHRLWPSDHACVVADLVVG